MSNLTNSLKKLNGAIQEEIKKIKEKEYSNEIWIDKETIEKMMKDDDSYKVYNVWDEKPQIQNTIGTANVLDHSEAKLLYGESRIDQVPPLKFYDYSQLEWGWPSMEWAEAFAIKKPERQKLDDLWKIRQYIKDNYGVINSYGNKQRCMILFGKLYFFVFDPLPKVLLKISKFKDGVHLAYRLKSRNFSGPWPTENEMALAMEGWAKKIT